MVRVFGRIQSKYKTIIELTSTRSFVCFRALRNGLAKRVTERLRYIIKELPNYDLVALQEVRAP